MRARRADVATSPLRPLEIGLAKKSEAELVDLIASLNQHAFEGDNIALGNISLFLCDPGCEKGIWRGILQAAAGTLQTVPGTQFKHGATLDKNL